MSNLEIFLLGIAGVFAIAGALALAQYRRVVFARVRAAYLRSRVTTGGPQNGKGLYLELPPPDSDMHFDLNRPHECSFGTDCARNVREAERQARAAAIKHSGPAA